LSLSGRKSAVAAADRLGEPPEPTFGMRVQDVRAVAAGALLAAGGPTA
jgi:hypothetical protein